MWMQKQFLLALLPWMRRSGKHLIRLKRCHTKKQNCSLSLLMEKIFRAISRSTNFYKQKTAYEMIWLLEFRRVLFRSIAPGTFVGRIGHGPWLDRDQRRCRGQ